MKGPRFLIRVRVRGPDPTRMTRESPVALGSRSALRSRAGAGGGGSAARRARPAVHATACLAGRAPTRGGGPRGFGGRRAADLQLGATAGGCSESALQRRAHEGRSGADGSDGFGGACPRGPAAATRRRRPHADTESGGVPRSESAAAPPSEARPVLWSRRNRPAAFPNRPAAFPTGKLRRPVRSASGAPQPLESSSRILFRHLPHRAGARRIGQGETRRRRSRRERRRERRSRQLLAAGGTAGGAGAGGRGGRTSG